MQRVKSLYHEGKRHLPLPTGPYTVGCFDFMTSYTKFGVFIRMFYPCNERDILRRHLQWPPWIPHEQYMKYYGSRLGFPFSIYKFLYKILVGDLFIPAIWHGELKESNEKYPVIVFSHGLTGFRSAYSSICMELASRGFVVASIEHRDHSAAATFYKKSARESASGRKPGSDLTELEKLLNDRTDSRRIGETSEVEELGPYSYSKEWVPYVSPQKENETQLRTQQLQFRMRECSEALDLLEDLNNGRYVENVIDQNCNALMFKDKLNLSKTFFIGHSMGGSTGISSLASESRFKAGVFLDPWMYPFYHDSSCFSQLSQPFLCLLIQSFQSKRSLKIAKELKKLNEQGQFFLFKKALHRDVSDAPFVPKYSFSLSVLLGRRLDKFSALDITVDVILRFLGSVASGFIPPPASSELEKLKQQCLCEEDFSSIDEEEHE